MARKKATNLYVIVGAAFAVVVVVIAVVLGLLVHAASEDDEDSSSETTSISESESESESQPDDEEDPDGPAGPILPATGDDGEEEDPDSESSESSEEPESSESSESSEPPQSSQPAPSSSAAAPSSSTAPPSSSKAPAPSSTVSRSSTASKSSAASPAPSKSSSAPSSSSNKTTSTSSKSSGVTVIKPSQSSSSSSTSKIVVKPASSSKSSSSSKTTGNTTGTKLETPVISADSSNGKINVSWDEVDNAAGYKVDIYKGEISSTSTAKPVETAILDEYETDYTTSEISVVKDQTYTVKVQALGESGGKYANSNLRRATVTGVAKGTSGSSGLGKALTAPKNLYTDLDDGFLTISWDTVDDAADYSVELYRPNGKLLESDTTQYTEYSFTEELDEKGTYKVQVQANPKSSSKYKSSAFTAKSIKMSSGSTSSSGRLESPEFSISRSSEAVKIRWETVSKAEQYYLEILDPNGKVVHSITLEEYDDNPYPWYGDMLKKGTWKIRMKAIDEDGDYKDSAYNTKSVEVSSGRLETPSISDVSVDSSRRVSIEINGVDDAASYQINIDGKNYSFEPTGIAAIRGTPTYRSGQLSRGKHTVKVRARAGEDSSLNTSDWSSSVTFEVD